MTPVDIDKLKELLAGHLEVAAELQEFEGYLAMLIAKAERVDALERIMREIEKHATMANNVIRLNRDGGGNGRVKVATCMHHIERLARNALSPKESE